MAWHTAPMAAIDWGEIWDWLVQPGVVVPLVLALVGGAYKLGTRRNDRRDRHADRLAEVEAERLRQEATLDATHVSFGRLARAPYGSGTGRPAQAAVEIEPHDAGVWIHGVRLSWRYRTDPEDSWRLERAPCAPFDADEEFPAAVPEGEPFGLTWPGSPLPEQQAITWELEIEWGVSRTGGTRVAKSGEGSTSWQEV